MGDDSAYGLGCPVERKRIVNGDTITETVPSLTTMHGGTYKLNLITNEGMKVLSYYMLKNSEETCPGKEGRQQFLKLTDVMLGYFKKKSVFYVK